MTLACLLDAFDVDWVKALGLSNQLSVKPEHWCLVLERRQLNVR
jgi:hypothetical protein